MSHFVETSIIIATIIFIGIPASYLTFKIIFKKSIIVEIGTIMTGVAAVIAIEVKLTEGIGLLNMIWTLPLAILFVLIGVKLLQKSLLKPLKDVEKVLSNVSRGKLDVNINKEILDREDELGGIARVFTEMNFVMQKLLNDVVKVSDAIIETGNSLNSDSYNMTQLASEQASAVEEVSTLMEEIVSSISKNTETSMQASSKAKKTAVKIDVNNKNVQRTVKLLNTIVKKIGIISDIAFQTNILSLNAAIEASRAGEYGKGFNVVSREIRKLSNKSKNATYEIEKISRTSVKTAERTSRISKQIVPEVRETSNLIKAISLGSSEQKAGAKQINNSVQKLNKTTQKLTETFQHITVNAKELKELSDVLSMTVSFFRKKDDQDKEKYDNKEIIKTEKTDLPE